MKKKILVLILLLSLLFSSTGVVFAIDQPIQPTLTDATSNESIKQYNKEVEEYNKKVDEYNIAVDAEYEAAAESVKQQNEAGLKTQEESQKAHDDAVAKNEQATADADRTNKEIDNQNEANQKEINDWNAAEDNKVNQRQQEITDTNNRNEQSKKDIDEYNAKEDSKVKESEQNRNSVIENNKAVQEHNTQEQAKVEASEKEKADVEKRNAENEAEVKAHNEAELEKEKEYNSAVEAAYEIALQAEADRIARLVAENKAIETWNQSELDRVAAEEKANKDEEARINAENVEITERNTQAQEKYDNDYAQYLIDQTQYEQDCIQYQKDKDMEAQIIALGYESVEAYNARMTYINENNTKYNAAYEVDNDTANNSPTINANAPEIELTSTYSIVKGETESGRKIPVHIEHNFLGTTLSYSDDFEIDANDIITLKSFASTDNAITPNASFYFFYNTDSSHSRGMWSGAWSELYTNPTAEVIDEEWNHGDVHTITYKDSTNEYQWYFEDITLIYNYQWIPLGKTGYATYNIPHEPTKPTKPQLVLEDLKEFEPNPIVPAEIKDLIEIIPNEIIKGNPYEKDIWEANPEQVPEVYTPSFLEEELVPDLYEPQYKTFVPEDVPEAYVPIYKTYTAIEHVVPTLVEIPQIIYWTLIEDPTKPTHLSHLNIMDLLPDPEPIVEPEPEPEPEPIVEPAPTPTPTPTTTTPTPTSTNTTNNTIVADNTPKTETTKPATTIPNDKTPKAAPIGAWALINLIATILSCIIALIMMFAKKKDDEEDEEENETNEEDNTNNKKFFKLFGILVGIVSIIIFIFTEDMTLPMILVDKWTIFMILLLIIEIINIFIIKHESKKEEEDE